MILLSLLQLNCALQVLFNFRSRGRAYSSRKLDKIISENSSTYKSTFFLLSRLYWPNDIECKSQGHLCFGEIACRLESRSSSTRGRLHQKLNLDPITSLLLKIASGFTRYTLCCFERMMTSICFVAE